MGGCTAHLFAQNFDAVLVVIVISAGDAIFAKFHKKLSKRVKLHILRVQTPEIQVRTPKYKARHPKYKS